jgi:PKD repeat protein
MVQRKILMFGIVLCMLIGGASALPEDPWREGITVTAGVSVQNLTFGTDGNGTDSFDQYLDDPTPPATPDPEFDAYFEIGHAHFDRLYGDIRHILSADEPERIWTLQVLSTKEDAVLTWNSATLPEGIAFTLSAAGSDYDMKGVASASLMKGKSYAPVTIQARYSSVAVPVANFTANRTTGPAPLTVQFTDTSTGEITAWLWDFGDENALPEQNPVHTYTVPGTYTVSLTVRNTEGEDSVVKEDVITVGTTSSAWREGITVTAGVSVQNLTFGTDENGTDSFDLHLDDPAPPATPGPEFDAYFEIDHAYFDRLYGDIRHILSADEPERIWTLQVLSTKEDAVLTWNSATLPEGIAFTLSAAGSDYDMKEVASVSLMKGKSYAPVTIRARYSSVAVPVANFTANRTTGPAPLTVQFTDTSTGEITAWLWDFGDNTTAITRNTTHTYSAIGVYIARLTITGPGGNDITERTIIATPPETDAAFTANVTAGVVPLTVQFTDTSAKNPSLWLWDFGDGSASTAQYPIHTYTLLGNHTVTLSINGNISTVTKPSCIKVTPVLFGDANEDGKVNQADTLHVLKQVVGLESKPGSSTEQFQKTDVNHNGAIDVGDALFIAQYNVGLRDVWFELLE